jgi:membrane-bound ClpP family serine protease
VKERPWTPFIIPLIVFPLVAVVLATFGMFFYIIGVATKGWIPGLHSGVVIILALIISFIVMGIAAAYASRPAGRPARHER